ncbi:leucine--tRNA ligase [Spiroplasma endosymbiont of Asaphidion curtum]|uniref:leucine--tRNA ligase n=1 Tax=Spiroplasma endosymbiont of Asaphidion curtum TaxID=3066281 RepID=UPI00313C869A
MIYSHRALEKKWQEYWKNQQIFKTPSNVKTKKTYILDMFPYPSGAGLHVGHLKGYIATDVMARFRKMQGYAVLHPIGWDAFGLPAEQYALKTKNNPVSFTLENINNFRHQLQRLGFSYDYNKEINTTDPNYYQWTQWIFSQIYKKGLVQLKWSDVNWCEKLGTVLANEEVLLIEGKMVSERGHYPVIKRPMQQWVLKITNYASRLLKGLDDLDWPNSVKELQRNWIGERLGALVDFKIQNSLEKISVFTTRLDTIFGISAIILAPEHPLVVSLTIKDNGQQINEYLSQVKMKTDLERQELNKGKQGVFTGSYALHPLTNELIPIWVADYVLYHYGTGAIMCVPAHSAEDYLLALKYNLPIKIVIENDNMKMPITGDGIHINSQFLNGLNNEQAISKVINVLEAKGIAKKHTTYKLRDWLFSRQRYWGEPFPIIFWDDDTISLVDELDLPIMLPLTDNIVSTVTGQSPLANMVDFVNVTRNDGVKGKRDTNTMPQWAGSCWYYLAYILKQDNGSFIPLNSKTAFKLFEQWLPVDLYVGGQEHAVLHLLYARFWHQVLYDLKVVPTPEPFMKLVNQGMILGVDGEKMSKSKDNGVNPDDIIMTHGADALRVYEMFLGPLTASMPWNIQGMDGTRRWLDRIYRLVTEHLAWIIKKNDGQMDKVYHQTVFKVTTDLENLAFNTAISSLMVFVNACYKTKQIYLPYFLGFIKMLSLFAVHLAEELWLMLARESSVAVQKWPEYDAKYLVKEEVVVVVQVNGKLRGKLNVVPNLSQEEILKIIQNDDYLQKILYQYEIKQTIFVMNKIINFVTKVVDKHDD